MFAYFRIWTLVSTIFLPTLRAPCLLLTVRRYYTCVLVLNVCFFLRRQNMDASIHNMSAHLACAMSVADSCRRKCTNTASQTAQPQPGAHNDRRQTVLCCYNTPITKFLYYRDNKKSNGHYRNIVMLLYINSEIFTLSRN